MESKHDKTMSDRILLDEILRDILGEYRDNCYFSPPDKMKLKYPCIVYRLSSMDSINADNVKYKTLEGYDVTVMDKDPDSPLRRKVFELPFSSFNRNFTSGGVNNWVFKVYYGRRINNGKESNAESANEWSN